MRSRSADAVSPSPTDAAAPGSWWRCRALRPDGMVAWYAIVASDAHPDETTVELDLDRAAEAVGADAECVAHLDETERVTRLEPGWRYSDDARRLWFVESPEPSARPPASNLVAFIGHDVEPGALLTPRGARELGVGASDQVGAMRWIPGTGQSHQVYVQPAWRRRGLATGIGVACATLQAARLGTRLWGDGHRTAMGERWRAGTDWAHLAADLTYLEAPMTPVEQREPRAPRRDGRS